MAFRVKTFHGGFVQWESLTVSHHKTRLNMAVSLV